MSEIDITGQVSDTIDEKLMAKWRPKLGDKAERAYREIHRLIVAGYRTVDDAALASKAGCSRTALFAEVLPRLDMLGLINFDRDNC